MSQITHARRLASGKSDTIGYVLPKQDGQLTETFLGELMAGMAKTLAGCGWDLMVLAPQSSEDELAIFKKIARARHVSGLIISRTYIDDPRFRILQDLKIPLCLMAARMKALTRRGWMSTMSSPLLR